MDYFKEINAIYYAYKVGYLTLLDYLKAVTFFYKYADKVTNKVGLIIFSIVNLENYTYQYNKKNIIDPFNELKKISNIFGRGNIRNYYTNKQFINKNKDILINELNTIPDIYSNLISKIKSKNYLFKHLMVFVLEALTYHKEKFNDTKLLDIIYGYVLNLGPNSENSEINKIINEVKSKSSIFRTYRSMYYTYIITDKIQIKTNNITEITNTKNINNVMNCGGSDTIIFRIGNDIVKYPQDTNGSKREMAIYSKLIPFIKKATPFVIGGKQKIINLKLILDYVNTLKSGNKQIEKIKRAIPLNKNLKQKLVVTEYKKGVEPLHSFLERTSELDESHQQGIFFQIVWTLYIFSLVGLRHLDLHTNNILIRKQTDKELEKFKTTFIMHNNTILKFPKEWFRYHIYIFDYDRAHQKPFETTKVIVKEALEKDKLKSYMRVPYQYYYDNHPNNKTKHFYYQDLYKIVDLLKLYIFDKNRNKNSNNEYGQTKRRKNFFKFFKNSTLIKQLLHDRSLFFSGYVPSPASLIKEFNKNTANKIKEITPEKVILEMYKKYIVNNRTNVNVYNARYLVQTTPKSASPRKTLYSAKTQRPKSASPRKQSNSTRPRIESWV